MSLTSLRTPMFVCCSLAIAGLSAQESYGKRQEGILVKVVIVDNHSTPLPGATVKVDGIPVAQSNENGEVSIKVLPNALVEIHYLGMNPHSIRVTRPVTGNIMLTESYSELDQVVITGYSRTTKNRTTGSLTTLSAKDLQGAPTANIDMLLQGKIAGVDIKAVSGRPGETAKVRIRGTNTITGNADPLWVVDGVPLQHDIPTISSNEIRAGNFNNIFSNGISGINPNDIESVTVLKDASAAAIYGSRAAGGVIVVTTKRGQEGKMRLNYSANVSVVTAPSRDAGLMNSQQKLAWEQELWDEFSAQRFADHATTNVRYPVVGIVGMIRSGYGQYAGMTKEEQDAEIARLGRHSTDWFEELFQNSVSQNHYLSLSGGSEKSTYYVSLGYSQNNGLQKKTDYDRYNVSAKLDIKPNKRVKLGFSFDMAMQEANSPSADVNPYTYAYFANPYERVYNEDGSYAADNTYFNLALINGSYEIPLPAEGFNIMREINETSNKTKNFSSSLIANLTVNILDNLSFEGLASFGYVTNSSDNINGANTYAAWTDRRFEGSNIKSERKYGSILQNSAYNTNYNLRGQLHYFTTFADDHYISLLGGAEIRGQYSKSIYEKRYGYDPVSGNSAMPVFPEGDKLEYGDMLSYASIMDGLSGQSILEDAFASFYFSLDYVLKERYILSLTARTDGSNNFGSDEQFNPTGSLGLGWNISQEPFMEPLKPILSSLSLRAAFGYTGNINKSVYPQLVMDYESSFRRTDSENFRIGSIKNAPNPNLRWEKTRDMKLGLEIGFFDDRLRLSGEIYDRRTSDAVTSVTVPYTTGFSTQSFNTSKLLNQGAELSITGHILNTKDWKLSATANISYNRNKLLEYDYSNPSIWGTTYVGYPLNLIISGKVQGIDPKYGIYTYEVRPDVVMQSASDRAIAENYAFYLGTSTAPTNGGYSITVGYKGVSLSLGGSYSINGKIVNNIESPADYREVEGNKIEDIPTQDNDLYSNHLNVSKDASHRWTPDNPITDGKPRIIDAYGDYLGLNNYMITSRHITRASMMENVSYFKLNSLMVNYNFGGKWMKRTPISSLSVSFTVNNLLTITNYSGIDPETPGAVYPIPRTYTMGVSVGF